MEDHLHPHWKALVSANLRWKVFVHARDEDPRPEKEKSSTYNTSFTGEEAKEIYEDILQKSNEQIAGSSRELPDVPEFIQASTSSLNNCHVTETEICETKLKFDTRSVHRAMRYAENNEVCALTDMLRSGFNVNSKDEHGWSILMVAACAGSLDVVQTLLKYKARSGIRDPKGNTAIYLASIKGHNKIVDVLIKSRKRKCPSHEIEANKTAPSSVRDVEFFCDVCKIMIKESTHIQHETSIVHQFNIGSATNKTVYGISPSNKGYQLLVNQGWNTEKGLGPESSGAKFPVKTVLKRNREGLGGTSKEKARITHFGPGDESAVKRVSKLSERIMRPKILSKKERKKEKLKEMKKEIELRRMLHEPDYY